MTQNFCSEDLSRLLSTGQRLDELTAESHHLQVANVNELVQLRKYIVDSLRGKVNAGNTEYLRDLTSKWSFPPNTVFFLRIPGFFEVYVLR